MPKQFSVDIARATSCEIYNNGTLSKFEYNGTKKHPRKLERRRSICVDTVGEMQEKAGIEE